MVPGPLEKLETRNLLFCNCLIHKMLQNVRCQLCEKDGKTRPWHCTNIESKQFSERSDFACRRTAASAAESLPRGEGFREGVTVNRRSPPIPVRENPAVKAGLFACTGSLTIIEPIWMILERCI